MPARRNPSPKFAARRASQISTLPQGEGGTVVNRFTECFDMAKKADPEKKIVADNRKARFSYSIEDTLEAGIMLFGSEVKSLRSGRSTIAESYAYAKDGELFLVNSYIPEYTQASRFNHEPRRQRKLLVHKREANKLAAAIQREGMTLVPLRLYFNPKGIAKIELGIAKGKKLHDKRETEKQRDWQRDKARLMRNKG
jgi:SsrA-binding protein